MMNVIIKEDADGDYREGKSQLHAAWFQKGQIIEDVKLIKNKYVQTRFDEDGFVRTLRIPKKYCDIYVADKVKSNDNKSMKNKHIKQYIKELKAFSSKVDDGDIDNAIENLYDEGCELGEALSDLRCAIEKVLEIA